MILIKKKTLSFEKAVGLFQRKCKGKINTSAFKRFLSVNKIEVSQSSFFKFLLKEK